MNWCGHENTEYGRSNAPSSVGRPALLFLCVSAVNCCLTAAVGCVRKGESEVLSIYVSTGGNDNWTGWLREPRGSDGPLATFEAARDAIRRLKQTTGLPPGGVTVWICGGTYHRSAPFTLGEQDSGTAEAPIVYRACEGETVRVMGGRAIRGFEPVSDPAILRRLDPAARPHVLQTNLKAQGITDFGQLRSRGFARTIVPAALELFFQGRPMTLARWPNDGFTTITGFHDGVKNEWGEEAGKLENGFFYESDRPKRWKLSKDIWAHGYWAWDWANSYERIETLDPDKGFVKTAEPYGLYSFRKGQRFYFLNILEELDSPGEWYLDRDSGVLYFWPPAPIAEGEAIVSLLEEPLVSLKDVSHVTFRALTLECTRGNAIEIAGGTRNLIAGCTIRNIGNNAVVIEGGTHHGVAGCEICHTGDGGVTLNGGDRKTLTPGGHFVHNNHFHHLAYWSRCYRPAALVGGVGHRVSHNLIHDHPHTAILFSGNDHIVEFNEIHHVALETGDVGAIYTGRDYTFRGNVVRYNFIHHLGGMGYGSMAVYMDDCVCGTEISGNIFWHVQRAAFIGGGRDHKVVNNIFVDCHPAVWVDARGISEHPVWRNMVYNMMKPWLDAMNHHQPPYSVRYPEIADVDKYYAKGVGIPPENNVIARNICVGGVWLETDRQVDRALLDIRDNLVDEDPHFVAPERGDFRLKDDSPAWKLGFKRIPIEGIGLIVDEYRSTLPTPSSPSSQSSG